MRVRSLGFRDAPEAGGPWLARFAEEFPAARHIAIGVDTTEDLAATDRESQFSFERPST